MNGNDDDDDMEAIFFWFNKSTRKNIYTITVNKF